MGHFTHGRKWHERRAGLGFRRFFANFAGMEKTWDVLFIVDSGIGNALEALYAFEHCRRAGAEAALFLGEISRSFQDYLRSCYGPERVLPGLEGVHCRDLVHSFTHTAPLPASLRFERYFYVQPDALSTRQLSETDLSLHLAQALFPGPEPRDVLEGLREDYSDRARALAPEGKLMLYAGSTAENAVKRWPHFAELERAVGPEKVFFVGGRSDYDFRHSHAYGPLVARLAPQPLLNRQRFWRLAKGLGLTRPHAHFPGLPQKPNAYYDLFSWPELVALARRCRGFVGNDGGLAHLAGAAGARGLVLFGPSSLHKNRPRNPRLRPIALGLPCSPCQFGAGGVSVAKYFINCPYQVRCMSGISAQDVLLELEKTLR